MRGRRYVLGQRRSGGGSAAVTPPDFGSAYRWQHGAGHFVYTDAEGTVAAKAKEECALDRWLEAGGISSDEHKAGLRFRSDFYVARVASLAQASYAERVAQRSGAWASQAELRQAQAEKAYRRWKGALNLVPNEASRFVVAVCCEDSSIGWANRQSLREGLQSLQTYYKV